MYSIIHNESFCNISFTKKINYAIIIKIRGGRTIPDFKIYHETFDTGQAEISNPRSFCIPFKSPCKTTQKREKPKIFTLLSGEWKFSFYNNFSCFSDLISTSEYRFKEETSNIKTYKKYAEIYSKINFNDTIRVPLKRYRFKHLRTSRLLKNIE